MVRVAERLTLVLEDVQGLLTRTYNLKSLLNNTPPPVLVDKGLKRIQDHFLKNFPAYPRIDPLDKSQSQIEETLRDRHTGICEQLEAHYLTFLDVLEFKEQAFKVLSEIVLSCRDKDPLPINFEDTPDLFQGFMDLFVRYSQLIVLVNSIEKNKLLAVSYAYSYQFATGNVDSNFVSLATFFQDFSNPIRNLQEDFLNLTDVVGTMLLSLQMPFFNLANFDALKQRGVLSVLANADELQYPPRDPIYNQIPLFHSMCVWIQWGYLLCPRELTSSESAPALLQMCLAEGIVATVFRKELIEIQEHYYPIFADYNEYKHFFRQKTKAEMQKIKRAHFKPAVQAAINNAPGQHIARREYLFHELGTMLALLQDCPGLAGPKIQLILCLVALSRDEVLWYARHAKMPSPLRGKAFKKGTLADIGDSASVAKLIMACDLLVNFVREHADVIVTYYKTFLMVNDRTTLDKALALAASNISDERLTGLLQEIYNAAVSGEGVYFPSMRLNWLRGQVALSFKPNAALRPVLSAFNKVIRHSSHVDDIEGSLRSLGSFSGLLWFSELFLEIFVDALKQQADACGSLIRVCGDFCWNAHSYLPEEQEVIGGEAEKIAREMIKRASRHVQEILVLLHQEFLYKLDRQTSSLVAHSFSKKASSADAQRSRVASVVAAEMLPGDESDTANRDQIKVLTQQQATLVSLCYGLSIVNTVNVYKTQFVPLELIKVGIQNNFKGFAVSALKSNEMLRRPTSAISYIESYLSSLCQIQGVLDCNVADIAKSVLLEEFTNVDAGPIGGRFPDVVPPQETQRVLSLMCNTYLDIAQKSSNVFSPVRKAFVAFKPSASAKINPEEYTDPRELVALAKLVGPVGIRAIDQACLRATKEKVNSLMTAMTANYAGLKQLQAGYRGEEITQALKALSGPAETLMTLLTGIGSLIEFRKLLHQGLRDCFERKASGLTESLDLFCKVAGHGEVRDVNSQLVDLLAHDCGVGVSTYADPAFRNSINAMVVDPMAGERWELLPHAFASVFAASSWRDVEFNPLLGAHSNNAHCMVAAMVALTHTSRGAASSGATGGAADVADKKKKVCDLFAETARVSSAVLLKQFAVSRDRSRDIRNMFIFFDKLILAVEADYPSVREHALPYSMISGSYIDLFTNKKAKGSQIATVTDDEPERS